jgi:hypothetical protein
VLLGVICAQAALAEHLLVPTSFPGAILVLSARLVLVVIGSAFARQHTLVFGGLSITASGWNIMCASPDLNYEARALQPPTPRLQSAL